MEEQRRIGPLRWGVALVAMATCLGVGSAQDPEGGEGETRGMPLTEPKPASASQLYARRHALVVGIDHYQHSAFPTLGYAVADAKAIAKILVERYGFPEEEVHLLTDSVATRAAILRELEDWAGDSTAIGSEDLLVVFMAGHGVTRTFGDSERGYFVPADGRRGEGGNPVWSSLIGMNLLEDVSEVVPAKHALFVLDCCFGGLAVHRSAPSVVAGLSTRARQILTAGDRDQPVLDAGGGGHSVFTGALLEALRGAADLDLDGVITFGEIYNHVGREVEAATGGRQTPLNATFPDHGGGNVSFFAPGVRPGGMSAAERLRSLERTADEQLAELKRLSDALLVQDLRAECDELYPPLPDVAPRMRVWLSQVRRLLRRLPQHRESVTRVRQEAYLEQLLAGELEEGSGAEPDWKRVDPERRWRYETFRRLVAGLEELERLAVDVEDRLEVAMNLRRRSIEEHEELWSETIAAIASDPTYGGLELEPQLGLVPLGPDPDSGLQEFAHLLSGEPAERDPGGRLVLEEETGVVLVLLPGGSFLMGSQNEEPSAPCYDEEHYEDEGPVHEVTLSPFFLSKFEVTQAQWKRWTGESPSYYGPGFLQLGKPVTGLHPVENIAWEDADVALYRVGLTMPTEAQWEYAARAGSTTPWWCGDDRECLVGYVNLADGSAKAGGANWEAILQWPELEDGWVVHAPVDALLPNPFGLHHINGNLWEWCRDEAAPDFSAWKDGSSVPGDGDHSQAGTGMRCIRGGSFYKAARHARSANRNLFAPNVRGSDMGVRPAMAVGHGGP